MSRIACLFPGQGSQAVGMGKDLFEHSPEVRKLFAAADEILGYSLTRICFEGPEEELKLTQNTQPALLLTSAAAFRLLGLTPVIGAGHSLGEYSALVAAGSLSFEDAILLVHKRGRFMQEAVPVGMGAMAAIMGLTKQDIEAGLAGVDSGVVEIANWNSENQIVIAGHKEAVAEALTLIQAPRSVVLPVSAPFHTRLMKPAEVRLSAELDKIAFEDLAFPIITNVDAKVIRTGEEAREALKRQVSRSVLWAASMDRMKEEALDACVEVGTGKVLSGLFKRLSRSWPESPDVFNVADVESLEQVRAALSGLP